MTPTTRRPLLVVAAGGLARELCAAVRAGRDHEVIGFLDDDPARHGALVDGVPVLGALETVQDHPDADVVLAAGRGTVRRRLAQRLAELGVGPERFANVIHPLADLTGAAIGRGVVALSGVVATAHITVGDHVVLMPNVTLTHDVSIGSCATLCAAVTLGGGVVIGDDAYLGMSSSVREFVRIGEGALLGMGAVVLEDVPADQAWAGVPAAPLRSVQALRAVR